jgi:hypothetical protein
MVMANQVQIPVIQTPDANQVQLQQNANKVLRNINNQSVVLQGTLSSMIIVGQVTIANLTELQFQSIAGTNWLLNNGQSCVDTDYSRLTGNNVVPTLTVGGINTFIRVNKNA